MVGQSQHRDLGGAHETYGERGNICSFLVAFAKAKGTTSYIQTIRPVT